MSDASRRDFLKTMGVAWAGLQAAGCIRKPAEHIVPFAKRPEDLVPGIPRDFATCWNHGDSVIGLVVRSTDGRPTKIEGNERHPMSRGGTNPWAQAAVLELYSPERSRAAFQDGNQIDADAAGAALASLGKQLAESKGEGFAILLPDHPSPTLERLLRELASRFPKSRLYRHDGAGDENARAGEEMVGIAEVTRFAAKRPRVIAAFDADPLATEGDVVAFNRLFAEGRKPDDAERMTRLYAIEPALTLTGSNADHRLAVRGAQVGEHLLALAHQLKLPSLPSGKGSDSPFIAALAEDLLEARGKSLVLVGERQPAQVHALGLLINAALGNLGETLRFVKRSRPSAGSLTDLASAIAAKGVRQLLILGGNPAHDSPGDLAFESLLPQVQQVVHVGAQRDETGARANLHIPLSHALESWGDLVARDGTVSIQQPLIAPLYASLSSIEVLARILGESKPAYELTRETHRARAGLDFEKSWRRWLSGGVVEGAREEVSPRPSGEKLAAAWKPIGGEGVEIDFIRDPSVLDGRYANSPWLQELPDPITKLVWDNAALVSPSTAQRLGLASGDVVSLGHHGKEVRAPIWVQAGTADDVVALALGYGREKGGRYASAGVSAAPLRMQSAPYILTAATLAKTSGQHQFACAQPESSEHGRHHIRSADIEEFLKEPGFVKEYDETPPEQLKSLWAEPNPRGGQQWGMTIDLSSCTSCGACTLACQAENNIPWVGKEEVRLGRVLHWIRVDRYLEPTAQGVEHKAMPVPCMQCETAPCENVCPVAATSHSPDGLNDMAYNRCIGTRYCANNCPYKVRRFNFYNYSSRNDEEYGLGIAMQRNPDVTVRFRGVMEKCTFCVQKISRARIEAKVKGTDEIKDGAVKPACELACPTRAITFGDTNDPQSRVSKSKSDPRNYAVLSELNTRPRTTYLARIQNPNPKLGRG